MTDRHTEDASPPPDDLRPTWSRSTRPVARRVVRPLQAFLETETSSAILLLVATIAALVWANAFGDTYPRLWETNLTIRLGRWTLSNDLRAWVGDGFRSLPGWLQPSRPSATTTGIIMRTLLITTSS